AKPAGPQRVPRTSSKAPSASRGWQFIQKNFVLTPIFETCRRLPTNATSHHLSNGWFDQKFAPIVSVLARTRLFPCTFDLPASDHPFFAHREHPQTISLRQMPETLAGVVQHARSGHVPYYLSRRMVGLSTCTFQHQRQCGRYWG